MSNNVLHLKGNRFIQAARSATGGSASMNGKITVTSEKILELKNDIERVKEFWSKEEKPFSGLLISVYYNKIVAKSNRIAGLLKGKESNSAIVGAKFNEEKDKHIITYYVDNTDLVRSIKNLKNVNDVLEKNFGGKINKSTYENQERMNQIKFEKKLLSKSLFKQIIADVSYIDKFELEIPQQPIENSIITLYDTKTETKSLLKKLGISIPNSRILDNQTVFLEKDDLKILLEKAPYLVSMSITDLSEFSPTDFNKTASQDTITIPDPTSEPTIGVIDTLFDDRVYFSKWVEYQEKIAEGIPKEQRDYNHGTAVSSIIVDGPRLNPDLQDNCGRFKVRHFGVATGHSFSSFSIIKKIKEIIIQNKDIKIWNISLGSNQEINDNFISAEAAVLDQIQYENDVIFVIAGTNKPSKNSVKSKEVMKIGSPADSINSMVVNSVTRSGNPTDYTRKGIVLSFFAKPDVSYYGGSNGDYINVCEPLGVSHVTGTSFAAPWIARKLSYLIDILGLNRELAKALIIDAAKGWRDNPSKEEIALCGHGIVPIKIDDILKTQDDEIKFLVSDISEKWNTYNYSFPIPIHDDKYPYIARATLCYFPACNITQGVDYTNTELNIHFGRINTKNKIVDIKGDPQNQEDFDSEINPIYETQARSNFRKWDNVKYVTENYKKRTRPKKSYTNKNWGIEIKTNNRLSPKDGVGLRFGIVITIKEINGVNRIDEFIKNCHLNGWLVNELDIQISQNIHKKLNEDIEFQ